MIRIEEGGMGDCEALARYHYAGGRPGPVCRVLRAVDVASGVLAGALVVSRPTLNARWRRVAWPGEYEDPDLRARARRINAQLRVISRLIVEPRLRACGVGTRLVRAYLAAPLTVRTEAVSAMGEVCPVFERAGMRAVRMAQRTQDGRLERFLARRGVAPESLVSRADAVCGDEEMRAELRMWANASRRTRGLLVGDVRALCRAAARALLAEPVAYVAGREESAAERGERKRREEGGI